MRFAPSKGAKAMALRTNRHAVYDLEYHLVVCTKFRHPVLVDEIRERLIEISYSLIEENYGCFITAIETDVDHVHIMFEAPPQVQLSKLVNSYKTVTSRLLRREFGHTLKPFYWKPLFWSESYFICTVSERSHETVKHYILNQGEK